MPDSGLTNATSQAEEGLNEEGQASQSEAEKAALQRMHQATQEAAEARREAAELKARMDLIEEQSQRPEVNPLEDDAFLEELERNPSLAIKYQQERETKMRGEFANVIRSVVSEVRGDIQNMDPERRAYDDDIKKMREDDQWQGFSDDQLLTIAKNQKESGMVQRQSRQPGAPTGGRSTAPRGGEEQEIGGGASYNEMKGREDFKDFWDTEIDDLGKKLKEMENG